MEMTTTSFTELFTRFPFAILVHKIAKLLLQKPLIRF